MHEDMRALLNPYLDNELHGTRLRELELHLAWCEACQDELKKLRHVSDLLLAVPVPEFMPVERFVINLNMRLPRRTLHDTPSKPGSLAWWLVPVGLLGAWFFTQTVFTLTNVVTAAQTTGMFGQVADRLAGGQQTIWFAATTSLFGAQVGGVQSTLSVLNGLNVFGVKLLQGFLWQALLVLLYWCWLFVLWLRRRQSSVQMGNAS